MIDTTTQGWRNRSGLKAAAIGVALAAPFVLPAIAEATYGKGRSVSGR